MSRDKPGGIRQISRAPQLPQNYTWLNTDKPLSLKNLKGRVVILDFWTYCCINCLHVLPDLKYLEGKYKNSLTVIGIHSAKFDREQQTESVRQAILRYDIEHPVLIDKEFDIWQKYTVRGYPTFVVIDPEGYVVAKLAGEGHRTTLDKLVEKLIQQYQSQGKFNFGEFDFVLEKFQELQKSQNTPLAFPGKVLATQDGLFIADSGHNRIIQSTFDGAVVNIIGSGKSGFKGGSFTEAQFNTPQGMSFDRVNQILYVADTGNYAIAKVNITTQQVETIAGTGEQSRNIYPHAGAALHTALNSPWDLVKIGNRLFIAIAGSHQIWEMSLDDNLDESMVRTYAGSGAEGCFDGILTQAAFAQPSGITTNGEELFIADSETSSIRGVGISQTQINQVRTICGSGGLLGFGDVDGKGEEVRLQHCLGIEYANNFLWIADTYNHKIKLVNPYSGNCQTVLGNGLPAFQDGKGDGGSFHEPSGLSMFDSQLYIADTNNHAIRCVDLSTLEVITLDFPGLCPPGICVPN
ncbi:MAG: thioredoxin-like domain-containing protein [Cyanobacteria bacterium P01_A01_bin.84]